MSREFDFSSNFVAFTPVKNPGIYHVSLQEGDTSLMLAAERGHVRVVEELVKAGAKLDLQNNVCLNTSSSNICTFSVDAVYVCEVPSWGIETHSRHYQSLDL